jgi:isoaspartyl peptidase/L-asparaginase-like protein (Ntn-hydrolase superfamily)
MVALDENGNLSGACTTSGLAWKMHGRVGDSPIIGAGMYCDNEVGAAAATGKGEAVIKICGSFLIVELMRQGFTPKEACIEAVRRIVSKQKDYKNFQVGFIALNKQGETGAYSINTGFQYALYEKGKNKLIDSEYLVHW